MHRTDQVVAEEKVFCVGFQKTGTSTLARALHLLGYSVTGPNFVSDFTDKSDLLTKAAELSKRHDAFQDNPWPLLFREMEELYPAARFILTKREPDKWLNSMIKQFAGTTTPMREFIYGYGCPLGHEQIFKEKFMGHNSSVLAHFENKPKKLLVLDLEQGLGWHDLCSFLETPIPPQKFPHENSTRVRPYNKLKKAIRLTLKGFS